MVQVPPGRRERYRAETREEAKRLALSQLAQSGVGAISLNAIARQMGVTGPALYRYFAGRDELLAELVVDAYEDLADTVQAAGQGGRDPHDRVRAVAAAYRDWALSQPYRYRLLFCTVLPGSGVPGERTAPAARRTMAALIEPLATISGSPPGPAGDPPAELARLGLAAWTRWHGVLSLQLGGHLDQVRDQVSGQVGDRASDQVGDRMGDRVGDREWSPDRADPDPAGVFTAEVDAVLDAAERLGRPAPTPPTRPGR